MQLWLKSWTLWPYPKLKEVIIIDMVMNIKFDDRTLLPHGYWYSFFIIFLYTFEHCNIYFLIVIYSSIISPKLINAWYINVWGQKEDSYGYSGPSVNSKCIIYIFTY